MATVRGFGMHPTSLIFDVSIIDLVKLMQDSKVKAGEFFTTDIYGCVVHHCLPLSETAGSANMFCGGQVAL